MQRHSQANHRAVDLVGAAELALYLPSYTKKRGQNAPRFSRWPHAHAKRLGSAERDRHQIRPYLAMLESISQNAKRECFCTRHGLVARRAVSEDAGQVADLCDPASILLAIDLNRQMHGS